MNSVIRLMIYGVVFLGMVTAKSVSAQSLELTGPVTIEELLESDRVFQIYVNRYEPDSEALEYLQAYTDSAQILVFFGNWCRESKKYIPGLIKTLNMAESNFLRVSYIGVDVEKKMPKSFLNKFDIEYIPTVVVLKGNVVTGRIEEKPHERIETDLVQILRKAM